jgi:hypothetical protein
MLNCTVLVQFWVVLLGRKEEFGEQMAKAFFWVFGRHNPHTWQGPERLLNVPDLFQKCA